MENFKGFSLFKDLEDKELQAYNRARIMLNIMEDHIDKKTNQVTPKGGHLVLSYFAAIPEAERASAQKIAEDMFNKRGAFGV